MGPCGLTLGIGEQWKPWLPLASCIMQRRACGVSCRHSGTCLYKCGALTLAASVSVTTTGCGHVHTCSSFWNSPACVSSWESACGSGTCKAPAPGSCDDLAGDRSPEAGELCVAARWFLGYSFEFSLFFLQGDSHRTSPSEAKTLQICPHGSVHDHCLLSQSFISSLAVLCVFMGFWRWQNLINPDALLCEDTQKFTGVCVSVWLGGNLESLWGSSANTVQHSCVLRAARWAGRGRLGREA